MRCELGLLPTKSRGCRDFDTSSCNFKRETARWEEEAANFMTHSVNRVPFLATLGTSTPAYLRGFLAWSRFIVETVPEKAD